MLYPSIDRLLKKVTENRFKVVVIAAKRARDLDDGRSYCTLAKTLQKKSIGIALEEMDAGTISLAEKHK